MKETREKHQAIARFILPEASVLNAALQAAKRIKLSGLGLL